MVTATKSYLWDLLAEVEEERLAQLLAVPEVWNSVYVDYEPPYVERLWTQLDQDHRLFLHRIMPCGEGEALWHPHPWPSIVRVLLDSEYSRHPKAPNYEQGIGYDTTGTGQCPVGMVQTVSGSLTYEMSSPHAWHYVRPLQESWSLMITGKPFEHPSPGCVKPTKLLKPLSEDRKTALLATWRRLAQRVVL